MNYKIKIKTLLNRGLINSGHLILKYVYAKLFSLPYALMIEPSDLCNLNCSICYTQKIKRKRNHNFLSFNEFKKIIDNAKNYCVYINLWIAGEPLLNKELERMISYANKKNIITCISTNAMLLTKERAERLIKVGLDRMIVSFDGATKESYEKIRINGVFETVLKNINNLTLLKTKLNKKNPFTSLQLVVTKQNEQEITLFKKIAKRLQVDEAYTKSLYVDTAQITKEKSNKIASLIPTNKKYIRPTINRVQNCYAKERTAIQCDGVVIPCCFDIKTRYNFGNINEKRFTSIWRSKKYVQFRNSKVRFKKSPLCSTCGCSRDYTVESLI